MSQSLKLEERLCFALYSASLAVSRAYKPLLDGLGITYPQYLVLAVLWENDAQTVGSIAEHLALESSTITPLVKRLEVAKFLKRERNPADERQVLVSLTAEGRLMQDRCACLGETLLAAAGMPLERLRDLNVEIRSLRDAITASLPDRRRDTA